MSAPTKVRMFFKDADEYIASQIREVCHSNDREQNHKTADRILLELLEELGFLETVKEFNAIPKWYA